MHGHHADNLFSFLPSLEDRIEAIRTSKPKHEQALRLYLIQDVTDLLSRNKAWATYLKTLEAYNKACGAYNKAREAYNKAREAYNKAQEAYNKAQKAYTKTREAYTKAREVYLASFDEKAFHIEHCKPDCPWDGQTIFP